MQGVTERTPQPVALSLGPATLALEIDTTLYPVPAVFRACYKFTDRCYLFLARGEGATQIVVTFMAKPDSPDLAPVVGEFCNELIDQQIRERLASEAGPIRELIVAQAFAEGNLLDQQREEGNYRDDPLGIGKYR